MKTYENLWKPTKTHTHTKKNLRKPMKTYENLWKTYLTLWKSPAPGPLLKGPLWKAPRYIRPGRPYGPDRGLAPARPGRPQAGTGPAQVLFIIKYIMFIIKNLVFLHKTMIK